MKRKNIFIDLLMLALFVVGVGALLYPFVSDSVNDYLDQQIINYYQDQTNQENQEEIDKIHAEMEARNAEIAKQSSPGVDPYSLLEEDAAPTEAPLSFYEQHTIGVVTVPKINVRLPIYDETLPALLEKGASLLDGTSFPTGGESTHSVLTSHSGLSQAQLFTELEKLEEGDEFYIEINNRTLAYKVDQIKVVLPTETDDVKVIEGQDLITLLTCTPYMINSHRLLVRGHRIPYLPTTGGEPFQKVTEAQTTNMYLFGALIIGLSLLVLAILIRIIRNYAISQRLYDLVLHVKDEEGAPLSNLSFTLYNAKGKKPVVDAQGEPIVIISDEQGEIKAQNLKGARYTLKNQEEALSIQLYIKRIKQPNFSTQIKKKHPQWKMPNLERDTLLLQKSQ